MDKAVKLLPELTSEEFHSDKHSIYLRATYIPDQGGFKVFIFNEVPLEDMDENVVKMAILVRGLAELALEESAEVFEIGYSASMRDQVQFDTNLTDEEKLLLSNPIGNA